MLTRPLARASVACALLVMALNLVDAFATLRHVAHGARELNPLMAWLLSAGPLAFFLGKHLLAGAGLIGILACDRYPAARRALTHVLLPVYGAVVVYQIGLFFVAP